ncbi:hypothetical protein FRC03_009120 [Tulasnella sp. 419]|nr:hypothetical protein FRC03_009120 [Tulasnella sp. 419]
MQLSARLSSRARSVKPLVLYCRTYSTSLPRPYRFHIGTSFAAKPWGSKKAKFPASTEISEWAKKQFGNKKFIKTTKDAGEDAFFVQEMKNKSGIALGVADGVGGWADSGVDPGIFSQALMFHAHKYAQRAWAGESDGIPETEEEETSSTWELPPEECLSLAYQAVLREKLVPCGSSTALTATLNARSGLMRTANLGDSGYLIIRNSNVIYTQQPQTHYFNCPRQLSKFPPKMKNDGLIMDFPEDADLHSVKLRHSDVVLFYTDGVSDNVWPQELAEIVSTILRQGGSEQNQVQLIADNIIHYTRQCMARQNKVSPFESYASQEGLVHPGGKVDDATVICCMVSEGVDEAEPTPIVG